MDIKKTNTDISMDSKGSSISFKLSMLESMPEMGRKKFFRRYLSIFFSVLVEEITEKHRKKNGSVPDKSAIALFIGSEIEKDGFRDMLRIMHMAIMQKDISDYDAVKAIAKEEADRFIADLMREDLQKEYKTMAVETHKAPNDKVTMSVYNPRERQWEAGKILVLENPKGANDRIITPVDIMDAAGVRKPDSFDRAIFNTCYSLIAGGNLATTTDIIFSHITGSDGRAQPSEKMRRAIKDSIIKISSPWIRIDVESVNSAFHYGNGKKKIYEGRLLDAKFKQVVINGKTVSDGITFWGKSPLVEVAESRGQILSFPKELLRVPVSATRETIAMREDLLRAVMNIVNHGTTPTILFSSVFESIGYSEMDKQQQQRTRKKAVAMMDYWKEQGVFKEYSIEKAGQLPVKFVIVPYKKKPKK